MTPTGMAKANELYPPECPHDIRMPPMRMQWTDLTMLHWRYPAEEVQRLLPDGLTVETFDGSAWVGLVPFQMRVDLPALPTMARWLHFPETNVRTYVRGKSSHPGVWFFSLEASTLPAVVVARSSYQVPYFWADMSITRRPEESSIRYRSRRRWPKPRGATSDVEIRIGKPYQPGEATALDHFLTARWALYGAVGSFRSYAKMFHEPWPLCHAETISCEDELFLAAGLPQPEGGPLVHFSPGVNVQCGWPGRVPT